MNIEKMIARRIRGGWDEIESRELLVQLINAHDGENLNLALQYWGFTR